MKQTQIFVWVYIDDNDNDELLLEWSCAVAITTTPRPRLIIVICLLMENKYLNLKPTIKMLTFQFCLQSISNGFIATESREVSLNENVYDSSVDYNSIDKYDILNIHKYLRVKSNIK